MTTQNSEKIVKEWIKQIEVDKAEEKKCEETKAYTRLAEKELDHLMIQEAIQEATKWKDLFHRLKRSATNDQVENFELKQEILRLTQELQHTIEMKERVEKRMRKVTRNFSTPRTFKGRHR